MLNNPLKILFLGDIVGATGRFAVANLLPKLKKELEIDMVIANGENSSGGMGITENSAKKIFHYGVDVITSGNHFWDKYAGIQEYIETKDPNVLRPSNYPSINPGKGYLIFEMEDCKVAVINAQGRVFMPAIDCPFVSIETILEKVKKETNIVFLDFHAEATAEKMAIAQYFDNDLSAFVGTHTHVQTNDFKILKGGAGYVTDAGMCGAEDSILGMRAAESIYRFRHQRSKKFVTAKGDTILNGVLYTIDKETGNCVGGELVTRYLPAAN